MNLDDLKDFTRERKFSNFRTEAFIDFRKKFDALPFAKKNTLVFDFMCESEFPIMQSGEKIPFARSIKNIPFYFTGRQLRKEYKNDKKICYDMPHNFTPNYNLILKFGLNGLIKEAYKKSIDEKSSNFFSNIIFSLNSAKKLVKKYLKTAKEYGNVDEYEALKNVPNNPAKSFYEALISIRFLNAFLYMADCYQIGLGRFDQYLWPYYSNDIKKGLITRDYAKELIKEFFISLNKDTDIYKGVQQGDNGQSLMLGGCDVNGKSSVNDLTYLSLEAAREVRLIDPKINLRVDSKTPDDLIELGCTLTAEGLGFPQYCNDDVVIPALVKFGYSIQDARNYSVAACWEFIIPGKGLEIVNAGAVSFPYAVDFAIDELIRKRLDIKEFLTVIKKSIHDQISNIIHNRIFSTLECPFLCAFMDGPFEQIKDSSKCLKYNNLGLHGAGISNAVDALCIIDYILKNKKNPYDEIIKLNFIKKNNFANEDEIRKKLLNFNIKAGNDDEISNRFINILFNFFAEECECFRKEGFNIRPGTGSAQFYVWLTQKQNFSLIEPVVGATIDGRLAGAPFASSLAPSQDIQVKGIISVLRSFSNIAYDKIINGGPITVEFSPSVFKSESGFSKVRDFIKYFINLGNQELQLNVLNIEELKDAMVHPEKHKNLIVRVWGWSGYFCELSKEYQLQIINRHLYA